MIDWVGFIPAAVLASMIPGASQFLGLGNAVRHGAAWALAGIVGRLAAFAVLIWLVMAGVGAILATSATALTVIKWVGAMYLAWIGIASLRRAWGAPLASEAPMALETRGGVWRVVINEFIVAISNPKAMLLFAALLPQFIDGELGAASLQIAPLGAAYLVVEFLVGLGYVGLGGWIGAGNLSMRTRRRVDFGSGVCFLGVAGLLAADDLA
jgi:threonine/homoserine/homoserine lactone efflux protein